MDIGNAVTSSGFAVARSRGAEVIVRVPRHLEAWADPAAMSCIVQNLIDNAIRHAPGTPVQVIAGPADDMIELCVVDKGPGIPPAQREEVFRPFVRLDKSRNRGTGGTGLGLAIARDIVHSHGGQIALGDSPSGGLRTSIQLPL